MYFACIPKKTFKSKVSKISVQGTFNMAMNVCEHDVNDIETTTNRTQINNLSKSKNHKFHFQNLLPQKFIFSNRFVKDFEEHQKTTKMNNQKNQIKQKC